MKEYTAELQQVRNQMEREICNSIHRFQVSSGLFVTKVEIRQPFVLHYDIDDDFGTRISTSVHVKTEVQL